MKALSRIYVGLIFFLLYVPILVLIIFSFNEGGSLASFTGVSLKWYRELFADEEALTSLRNSVVLAVSAALIATVIGTFGALGLNTMRKRWLRGAVQTVTNIPMMNPDIVTGVSMMLLFVAAATILGTSNTFGFGTLLIAHVTFDLPYVNLSVMPPNADTTTITGSSTASTILLTLKILFTEPTDVPPNFITFISLYIVEMVDTMCRKQAATACIDFN